jgi:carbamoyl-phosphate synthase large subunit
MYDKGYIRSENVTVESGGTVSHLKLFPRDGRVSSVVADMGKASFEPESVPVLSDKPVINQSVNIDGTDYNITCLSMGNPHCVVFYDAIDSLNLKDLGPKFENAPMFPDRANTEFVRVVGRNTLRLRVWERGTGETLACGTGACAAVAAAVVNGYCDSGVDIKVILPGGNLIVNYTPHRITLTGSTTMVFEGRFEY